MKFDIVALGELLIDFTPEKARTYTANAGGSPPNLLTAASKMGLETAFMGMVGNDFFGNMLEADMIREGIDVTGLRKTSSAPTTLAFVHLRDDGERSFTFIRNPGADILFGEDDIDYSIIDKAKIFHFSSVSMSAHPARETNYAAVKYAKSKGIPISYDPNLRESLWESLEDAKAVITDSLKYVDVLKVSEEELEFITGKTNLLAGGREIMQHGVNIVFITMGAKGCIYLHKDIHGQVPGFVVTVLDTTGAGDAFMGGALTHMTKIGKSPKDSFTKEELDETARFANAVGALATTKMGGVTGMPTRQEVENLLNA